MTNINEAKAIVKLKIEESYKKIKELQEAKAPKAEQQYALGALNAYRNIKDHLEIIV